MRIIVQIMITKKGRVYVRLLGLHCNFFYQQEQDGHLEPCPPPPPRNLALAKVEQRTF